MVEPSQKSYFPVRLIPYNVLFIFHADLSHRIFGSLRLFSLIPAS